MQLTSLVWHACNISALAALSSTQHVEPIAVHKNCLLALWYTKHQCYAPEVNLKSWYSVLNVCKSLHINHWTLCMLSTLVSVTERKPHNVGDSKVEIHAKTLESAVASETIRKIWHINYTTCLLTVTQWGNEIQSIALPSYLMKYILSVTLTIL